MSTPPRVRYVRPDICHLLIIESLMLTHEHQPIYIEALAMSHRLVTAEIDHCDDLHNGPP